MPALTIAALLITLLITARAWRPLRETTLITACSWSIAAICVALVAGVLDITLQTNHTGWRDLAWYAAAIMLLCPGIAVLGARRPGAAAWGFFVLLPLLLVLAWPAVASTRVLSVGSPLELEEPAVVGFGLVLIMAIGNWIGTRFTLPAILYAVGLVLLVAPLSATVLDLFPDRTTSHVLASLALLAASTIAAVRAAAGHRPGDVFNILWLDFVDTYGMVWAKRVMDRVNASAAHEKWSATLEWHGFEWQPDCTEEEIRRTRERIEHTLRWLLKRFVDPAWIDRRLDSQH
jgi:hypothetical protein